MIRTASMLDTRVGVSISMVSKPRRSEVPMAARTAKVKDTSSDTSTSRGKTSPTKASANGGVNRSKLSDLITRARL